jgi:D-psicose/D-tagatose/L-ribulose 3-epimerase
MNKYGIYYAFWTNNWDADFFPFIKKVGDIGFDILEINAGTILKLSAAERAALKGEAEDRSIQLSYCIGLSPEFDLSSDDLACQRNGTRYLKRIIEAISEMGGGKLSGIIYAAWPGGIDGVENKARRTENSVRNMRSVAKRAQECNVQLNVEVVNRFEQFMLNTCQEALDYLDRVDSPNVKMLLDTFHMNIEEDDICEAVKQAGERLGHLHIGENNRKPPGYGHIPWVELGNTLREMDYNGTIVMEPFLMPGGEVGRDIKVWRPIMPGRDLDDEARRALEFVREHL